MAKGYSWSDLSKGAAELAGQGAGKAMETGINASNESASGADNGIEDIQDEQSSQLTKDASQPLADGGKAAAEAPGRAVQTGKDIKNIPKRRKERLKKRKARKKKWKRRADFIKNPKKHLEKLDRAKKLRKNNLGKKGANTAKKGVNAAKKGANTAKKGVGAAKKGVNAAKKGVNTVKRTGKIGNAVRRATSGTLKAIKKMLKGVRNVWRATKAVVMSLLSALSATLGSWIWILLIILLLIMFLLCFLAFGDTWLDNVSTTGDFSLVGEQGAGSNNIHVEHQQFVQEDVSPSTKIITAYYTYYSTKSIWVLFEGDIYNCRTDTTTADPSIVASNLPRETVTINGQNYEVMVPVQYGSAEFIDIYQYDPFTGSGKYDEGAMLLKDKYERESNFYLSAESLASIDLTLHKGGFRYPEQLVQKVKYKIVIDEDGKYHYELDDLADENGNLYKEDVYDSNGKLVHAATLSTQYTQNESETSANWTSTEHEGLWLPCIDANGNVTEKTVGVWDYGFGSLLHYLKYIEAHENRGEVTAFEVIHNGIWDFEVDNDATDPVTHTIVTTAIAGNKYNYLTSKEQTVNLYKNAKIEQMDYKKWSNLTEEEKASYFTGEGKIGDPTHIEFNKNRVYGLPSTTAYMIDWVVTPAGTITTNVQTVWKDSGIPFTTIENDSNDDFSDEEFNDKDYGQGAYSEFNNGKDDDITYTDTTVKVQTITHYGSGNKAEVNFKASDIKFDANGVLTKNPEVDVALIRYVPTGDAEVDGKFKYIAFPSGSTTYALEDSIQKIQMFTEISTNVWVCNCCGEGPAKKTYKLRNHSGCIPTRIAKIPVYKADGTSAGRTTNYTVTYSGSLKIDSATGKITSMPTAYRVPYKYVLDANGITGKFVWYDSDYVYVNGVKTDTLIFDHWLSYYKQYYGTCRSCNNTLGYVEYTAVDHSGCLNVKYEYDVIEIKEMKVSEKIVDVDGDVNDQYVFPGGYAQLARTVEGTQWDKEPTYSGEPDTSKITGQKYYRQYFRNYETYAPQSIQGTFDFDQIFETTGLEEPELMKLLEQETLTKAVATLGGIEDYFVNGTPVISNTGRVSGYIGPGLGIVAFENGCPASEKACREYMEKGAQAQPNEVSVLAAEGWPNYGCCQMNRSTMDGFKNWMLSEPNKESLWNKLFSGIQYDISSPSTGFSQAWADSNLTLTEDEYITFMIYQIAYMYKIKVQNNWNSITKEMPNFANFRASQEMVLACGNNGALGSALKYGYFGTTATDMVNRLADIYSTYIGFGGYTATMRNKYNVHIRRYYLIMDQYNLPVFEWDESIDMFKMDGASGTGGGWNFNKFWNALLAENNNNPDNIYYPWNAIFGNSQANIVQYTTSSGKVIYGGSDANKNIERAYIQGSHITASDMEYYIAKIFATADKVPVSTYRPLTDDFFITKYHSLFDENLSNKWTSAKRGISSYFPDSWNGVFNKDKNSTLENETTSSDVEYTILKEFDSATNPVVMATVLYGGSEQDESGNTKRLPISIHSVSKGVIHHVGNDDRYGGTYVAIQYKRCVVYYGGITPSMYLTVGETVEKSTFLGSVPSGCEFYIAVRTGIQDDAAFIDPTQLLKGGLQEVVDLAREFLGYDYEWGGHGDKSCFSKRCVCTSDHLSYLNNKMYGFDCSGLVTYVFRNLGFKRENGKWDALGADGYRSVGEDVTLDYTNADGSIDWDSVPAGILVYFDWDGDGSAEHIGIWSGDNSLVHASGGNPYLMVNDNYQYETWDTNKAYPIIGDVTKNHAVHDNMIKEYFIGEVPSGAYNSPYAIASNLNTLRANAFNNYYKSCVIELRDFSCYQQ